MLPLCWVQHKSEPWPTWSDAQMTFTSCILKFYCIQPGGRSWKQEDEQEVWSQSQTFGSPVKSVKRHKFKHLYCWNWKRCRDENEKLSPPEEWGPEWGGAGGGQSADWAEMIAAMFCLHCHGPADGMTDVWPTWRFSSARFGWVWIGLDWVGFGLAGLGSVRFG